MKKVHAIAAPTKMVVGTDAKGEPYVHPVPSPLTAYQICDLDTVAEPQYFGFADPFGNWYIMRLTVTGTRYVNSNAVEGGYAAAWTGRAGLTYDYLFNLEW